MKAVIISFLLEPAVVVTTLVIWYGAVTVGLRAFGIRIPTATSRYCPEDFRKPSRSVFILVQTILFGGWFYLSEIVGQYVRAKFGLATQFHPPGYPLVHAISSFVFGAVFGWFMWRNSPWSNPYAQFDRLSINPEARDR